MQNHKNVKNYILQRGGISGLGEILNEKRSDENSIVVFLVDDFFKNHDVQKMLSVRSNDILIFVSARTEPKSEYIDSLVLEVKGRCKTFLPVAVIGMGGGTVMDIAKCVSIMLTNTGKAEDYQGWDLVKNPGVFKIGIPTISGTGAETSRTGIFESPKAKLGIYSYYSMFDQIILDPDFLKTVPKEQFVYTAMDCYVHDVELLHGLELSPMTKSMAGQSLILTREVFLGELDREKLMVASYFGGLAMASANVAGHICHPVAYGLGTVLGYRHGLSVCLAFNALEEYYPEVEEFRYILKKFNIELPKEVTKNISQEQIDKMAEATLKNEKPLKNAFGENWKEIFTKEKVKEIIKKI